MSGAAHTPGPWSVVLNENTWGWVTVKGPSFAVDGPTRAIGMTADDEALRIADAHLISASPDLLAATKALLLAIRSSAGFEERENAVLTARAVVAKAEGGAPAPARPTPDCRAETYASGTQCAGCGRAWGDDGPDECPEAVPPAPPGVRFPRITVQLSGHDGNAHVILGRVMAAMSRDGVSLPTCNDFRVEATSGDYDHLIQTCMKWVNVT